MSDYCWFCAEHLHWKDGEIVKDCLACGTENDRTEYISITEPLPREEKVIPQTGGKDFKEFIKLPRPLENKAGEINKGDSVEILDEFSAPESPKIQSFLIGTVRIPSGEERILGINMNSYYSIAKVLGKDTKDWIDKSITYQGLTKFVKGTGHLWIAKL